MERTLRALLQDGAFTNVPSKHTRMMSAVRGRNNATTERRFRFALVRSRVRGWRLHAPILGKPDFFFGAESIAVFVDGCFWHGCARCGHIPNRNRAFWTAKISRNRERDLTIEARLKAAGICVKRFWEHELREDLHGCVDRLRSLLQECDQKTQSEPTLATLARRIAPRPPRYLPLSNISN
jgi:DNA mismatch endonuclease, patch repair protein